jgi:hypothetical protein
VNGGDRGEFPVGSGFEKAGSLAADEIWRAWASWQEILPDLKFGRSWVSAVSQIRPAGEKGERECRREGERLARGESGGEILDW